MVYSSPPNSSSSSSGGGASSAAITYDDSVTQITTGGATETLQSIIEELATKEATVVESVSLNIPADTLTPVPLPASMSSAFDFRLFVGDDDITESVVSRKTANSFELLSLVNLTTTVLLKGTE